MSENPEELKREIEALKAKLAALEGKQAKLDGNGAIAQGGGAKAVEKRGFRSRNKNVVDKSTHNHYEITDPAKVEEEAYIPLSQ